MRALSLLALISLAATGASAASGAPISAHALALAAGYKAAFLCSGVFDAGEPEVEIAADDLEGIYPQYQAAVRTLTASIDRPAGTVSVAFDAKLPPRIAAWRPSLGCAQLPIGAAPKTIALLPRLEARPPSGADALPWPAGDRGAIAPRGALDAVVAKAFDHATYGAGTETTAVVVVAGGRIVGERYRAGFDEHRPQRTWSVAKSLTATLVGRAVQLGLVKVDAPADIPEWRAPGDPRAAITLADLMHMASGFWTDGPGNRTDEIYLGGAAVNEAATAMPIEAAPGSRFRYANNDALLAARSLRARLGDGQRALAFPFNELLWRIGMTRTTPETDWRGNFVLSSQVWTTARDLARLGLLYLNDGMWNGKRLLPDGWSRFVATPAPVQPENAAGGGPGYGAFFWLYGERQGLPAGTYAMEGNRGQYVFIVPARGVVIVRRGFDAAGAPPFEAARFVRDVLARAP
ncbi:MAG: beta-lactamase family protein [Pseudomonadota bacterium]|nr:beta-lactamase family protein [Pseudomonadota bacterium]